MEKLMKTGAAGAISILVLCCTVFHACEDLAGDCTAAEGIKETALVRFRPAVAGTRALDPDEMRISDLNIFVFNEYGILEGRAYLTGLSSGGDGTGYCWSIDLLRNAEYSFYACANFGYETAIGTLEDLKAMRYHIAYPDDYSIGMPMSGKLEHVTVTEGEVTVPLERLMARISICVDRSRLDEDVEFNIKSIKVERCPRSVTPFMSSHASDPFDFFPSGFMRKDYETDVLNTVYSDGTSGEVSLYMLENMQGDLLPGNEDESLKVLPENSGSRAFCSYIEIRSEYLSDSQYSRPGEYLVYRFYPGEDPGNFDICRNSEYKIRIMPEGSGLNGTEWRIDKSGIESFARTLELSYSSLNFSYAGESTVIRPYLTPEGSGDTRLYWDSDDKSVATVSGDGTVTARGEGTCRIICYAADGSGCSAECAVTVRFSPYYMKIFPGNFIRCRKGEVVEVSCEYFPPSAPFDVGIEELEYDKGRGIYDYAVGEDGKSVTLYTKERGSGLLYMEAGYPLNQAEMIFLVID